MADIQFSGQWAIDPDTFGVIFAATVNGEQVRCRVTTDALQDIDPENRMASPEDQFLQNQHELKTIAEGLIRDGRVNNGILTITSEDVR